MGVIDKSLGALQGEKVRVRAWQRVSPYTRFDHEAVFDAEYDVNVIQKNLVSWFNKFAVMRKVSPQFLGNVDGMYKVVVVYGDNGEQLFFGRLFDYFDWIIRYNVLGGDYSFEAMDNEA